VKKLVLLFISLVFSSSLFASQNVDVIDSQFLFGNQSIKAELISENEMIHTDYKNFASEVQRIDENLKFEYQIGLDNKGNGFSSLKGDVLTYRKYKIGVQMAYFKNDSHLDSGIYFQSKFLKYFLFSFGLGNAFINEESQSFVDSGVNFIIPKTDNVVSLGFSYRLYKSYPFNKNIFFLGLRY
jgi:hypothetical protein